MLKTILRVFAVMIILAGSVWFLQGINVLPGSYMSGSSQWAVNGGIAVLIGMGLFVWSNRLKK